MSDRLIKVAYTLMDRQKIRDTRIYLPAMLMNLAEAVAWGFEVQNNHDQAVMVQMIGGSVGVPGSVGVVGSAISTTIAAHTTAPIAVNIWLPFIGARVSYASAPASGDITVLGWVQVKK